MRLNLILLLTFFVLLSVSASAQFQTADNLTIYSDTYGGGVQTFSGGEITSKVEPIIGVQGQTLSFGGMYVLGTPLQGPQVVVDTPGESGSGGGSNRGHSSPFSFVSLNEFGSSYVHPSTFFPGIGEEVRVNVTLNEADGTESIILHYRVNNQSEQVVPMTLLSGTNTFFADLPVLFESGTVSYYVLASDSGFTLQTPPLFDELRYGSGDNPVWAWIQAQWAKLFEKRSVGSDEPFEEPFRPGGFNLTPFLAAAAVIVGLPALWFLRGILVVVALAVLSWILTVLATVFGSLFDIGLQKAFASKKSFMITLALLAIGGYFVWRWWLS